MKDKIKLFLNDDKLFIRVVVILISIAILSMFSVLYDEITDVNKNVRALIQGHYEQSCFVNEDGYLDCTIPDYEYLVR